MFREQMIYVCDYYINKLNLQEAWKDLDLTIMEYNDLIELSRGLQNIYNLLMGF